jgi:hypothetical protein
MGPRFRFGNTVPLERLKSVLIAAEDWRPFPRWQDREGWAALPEAVKRSLVSEGEQALASAWPHLPADVYLQFSVNGNRINFENPYMSRREILSSLVVAECIEGSGRFISAILNASWSICEESSWCLPAHISAQQAGPGLPDVKEPIVDLFAAESGAELAWVVYLLGAQLDAISPLVTQRIRAEIDARILAPALERDDFWWMGFTRRPVNNWNPWINSNWLACALLLETDAQQRVESVDKILRCLDCFLDDYPEDGGCDEGPNYWGRAGASLFDCLELLHSASGGAIDAYSEPLVREIGRFIYRAHISGDYYLNFADAAAVVEPEASLVFRYGRCIQDAEMMGFGAWLAQKAGLLEKGYHSESLGRVLPVLFNLNAFGPAAAQPVLLRDVWLPDTQVMAARDQGGSAVGLYLAAKGGHNDESHNHNDVGHFIVYKDGLPLIIDVGVETYTRKTFSEQRYEIWTMQSAYHSLPTIDGVQQMEGRAFSARAVHYQADEQSVEFRLDLAGAYPQAAGVQRWERGVRLTRGDPARVDLEDAFMLTRQPGELTLSLMTASAAREIEPGRVKLAAADLAGGRKSGSGEILFDPAVFTLRVEVVLIHDERLGPVWGERVFRLLFVAKDPQVQGKWSLTVR